MSDPTHIVHMAKQISAFFASYPHDKAVDGIADHMSRFWEPRMRRAILDHEAAGGDGLDEATREAVRRLKA